MCSLDFERIVKNKFKFLRVGKEESIACAFDKVHFFYQPTNYSKFNFFEIINQASMKSNLKLLVCLYKTVKN